VGTQNISSLGLSATAKKAAEELLKAHPAVVFTSGNRDLAEQADAMAGNEVKTRKACWSVSLSLRRCENRIAKRRPKRVRETDVLPRQRTRRITTRCSGPGPRVQFSKFGCRRGAAPATELICVRRQVPRRNNAYVGPIHDVLTRVVRACRGRARSEVAQ
jgi:hypothetical protein